MPRPKAKSHPARPFVATLLILCGLALFSFLREAGPVQSLESSFSTLQKRDFQTAADEPESCRHVHRHKDQCAFVKANCDDEESGLISYLTLYYCDLGNAKPVGFIIIAVWTALLFLTIGIAASDFFCVNLSTISNMLGMSESMAGVTFLAFGNGSPDVFSTFAAMKSNSGSLAVGELMGAAGFITAVVPGAMALVRPFKVASKSFVRDVGFFIIAVAFSMIFLANGKLTVWECAIMVGYYVFYVAVVCVWHWWLRRRRKRREREAAVRGHYTGLGVDESEVEEEYHDDEDRTSTRSYPRPITTHDLNELERADYDGREAFPDFEDDETRDKWMGEISSNMRVTKGPTGERKVPITPIRPSLVGALEFRAALASLQKSRNLQTVPINMRRYSDAPYHDENPDDTSVLTDQTGGASLLDASIDTQDHLPRNQPGEEERMNNRLRAASANAATEIRLTPNSILRRPRHADRDLLGSSPPRNQATGVAYGTFEAGENTNSNQVVGNSPLVSISPAVEDDLEQPSPLPRTNTEDRLAPPDTYSRSQSQTHAFAAEDSSLLANQKTARPPLKLPIPPSTSPKHSPAHSPFLSGYSTRESSRTTSFTLPPPSRDVDSYFEQTETEKPLRWWPYKILPSPHIVLRTMFPTLYGWRDKTWAERVLGVVSAPSFFLLTVTLPIVEPANGGGNEKNKESKDFLKTPEGSFNHSTPHPSSSAAATAAVNAERLIDDAALEESPVQMPEDHTAIPTITSESWNRWLVIIQCFTAPYLIVLVGWAGSDKGPGGLIKATLYSLLGSLIALFLLLTMTAPTRPPRWHWLLCFVGFAVSVAWISTIAEEVVGVLKTIGVIFNISDAILGLTIFAVGNSLGDLVADVTVARLGFPVMALSACFGGPMLNILLGIGLGGLYMTIHHAEKKHRKHPDNPLKFKPYHVEVSSTLLISAISLLVTLIGLLIVVPLNGWRMDKRIGWGLMILWTLTTVGNVIAELTGFISN